MSSILIRNVQLNGKRTDISIRGSRIAAVAPRIEGEFDQVIDGSHRAALPPFYNTHCHAAMTLLRGIADDMELFEWLNEHIWPAEAKLTDEDIYWGTRLACLEMIRSGTVFFNDMYFRPAETIRAVEDAGIRAAVGMIVLEVNPDANARFQRDNAAVWADRAKMSGRIQLTWAPHAIYTVGERSLEQIVRQAEEMQVRIHIHLAETARETADCREQHGCSPVEYLDRLGMLSDRVLAAHSVHLSDSDIGTLKKRGVHLAYMPCSNYKLSSGRFRFRKLLESGCHVTFGTDGCASNNNLNLWEEMHLTAILHKGHTGDPTLVTPGQVLDMATRNGCLAMGRGNSGVLEEGRDADLICVDLNALHMQPALDIPALLVYSAQASDVKMTMADGRILYENGVFLTLDRERVVRDFKKSCNRLLGI